jgi:hypothetical protein
MRATVRVTRGACEACRERDQRDWRACVACADGTVTERHPAPVTTTETRRRRTEGQR